MNNSERLDILVRRFAEDSKRYRDLPIGETDEEKRVMLRSLMNVRMPGPMDSETLAIQDGYLRERARERGVTELRDIPTIRQALGCGGAYPDMVSLWQGDITLLAVDAIVNAANDRMLGCFQPMHNCVDNCIHTFAGVELREECDRQMRQKRESFGRDYTQPTAEPMLTPGYNLPARYVVHIVGPIIAGRPTPHQEKQLADCYRNTLAICAENGIHSVAFCGISTGVFGYPKQPAAETAVRTVYDWLEANSGVMERVIFCVHGNEARALYEAVLKKA